jgi:hypothetical protein
MPTRKVVLTLEGPSERGGHIRVSDFLREIQLLLGVLRQTEREVNPAGGASILYEIVHLSHSSPAQVVVQAEPVTPEFDLCDQVVNNFLSITKQIQTGSTAVPSVSPGILQDLAGMAYPIGRTLRSVAIGADRDIVHLTPEFHRRIEQLLGPEETYPGAVRGMLEAINLHRDANVFRIYPDIGPPKVTCHFPAELEAGAIRAIGHFVEVRGTLRYKVSAPYPHEIEVEKVEAFPHEEEMPSLNELHGVAPEATGILASEEFVRKNRNATD